MEDSAPKVFEGTFVPARFVVAADGRFLLVATIDGELRRIEVDGRPSLEEALRWERSVRRVHGVRFCRHDDGWSATIDVTGHRLPSRPPVSLDTALALALRGHRVSIRDELATERSATELTDRGRLPL